jgi:hypothetical protein
VLYIFINIDFTFISRVNLAWLVMKGKLAYLVML